MLNGTRTRGATYTPDCAALHPGRLVRGLAAAAAVRDLESAKPPQIELPATLEVLFHNGDLAEMATRITGVTKVDARTVTITDDDPIRLFRTFITVVLLTRAIVE